MKNLKKVLAFVVVFAMMFSLAVSASPFPDVTDDASYAEAATVLNGIGLMIGDDQGNFNPDKTITRAEAATIIVRAKALGNAAAGAVGATAFTDVPADHWASGYINMATQSGIVAGYGDGTFGPEDPVTYEQMVKLIVAALGYTPKAEANGGYPTGYLVIASQEGITKGATGRAGEPAPRKMVARLVYNALPVRMMEQYTYGSDPEFAKGNDTLLSLLGIKKVEGVVKDSYVTLKKFDDADDKFVQINDAEADTKIGNYLVGDTDAAGLLGYNVAAYIDDDDDYNQNGLILAIVQKSGKNDTIELDYSQIYKKAPKAGSGYEIYYDDNESLEVVATPSYYYNGLKEAPANKSIAFLEAYKTKAVMPGKVRFLDNNGDGKYEFVFVTEYTGSYVVDEINESKQIIETKNGGKRIDLSKEGYLYTFYKDGALAAFEDVKEGDVLTLADNDKYCLVYISDDVVEGTVSEITGTGDKEFKIDGNVYKLDYVSNVPMISEPATGDEGIFYLNVDNRIVDKEVISSKAGNYAYLFDAAVDKTTLGKDKIAIKYLTSEGTWETANLASKISVYKGANSETSFDPLAPTAAEKAYLDEFLTVTATAPTGTDTQYKVTEVSELKQLIKYQKNSAGEITKIYVAGANDKDNFSKDTLTGGSYKYNATTNMLDKAYLDDSTIVFNIPSTDIENEDKYSIATVKATFSDGTTYNNVESYDELSNEGYAAVLVAVDAKPSIDDTTRLLVLTNVATGLDSNGNEITKFYGYQEGQAVSAESSESIEYKNIDGTKYTGKLEAGDVVIFSLDSKGAISEMEVLMTAKDAKKSTFNLNAKEGQYAENQFGRAYEKKSNYRVTLEENNGNKFDVTLKGSDYNVYKVNINKDIAKVEVSSYSEIDFDKRALAALDGESVDFVFVRSYDNVPVDVVVYTYTYEAPAV